MNNYGAKSPDVRATRAWLQTLGVTCPSDALAAMVRGLETQDSNDDLEINMMYYIQKAGDTCFACAATCTLVELVQPTADQMEDLKRAADRCDEFEPQSIAFNLPYKVVQIFENAMDNARVGELDNLWNLLGLDPDTCQPFMTRFPQLNNHNWRHQLPGMKVVIERMKEAGF